jgi:hypothetical protein
VEVLGFSILAVVVLAAAVLLTRLRASEPLNRPSRR